jgi:hypothetical protein
LASEGKTEAMSLNSQFRRNVRIFYAWIGSTVLLGASPIAALWLIHRDTTFSRAAGVVVGVAGTLPWLWVLAVIIRRGDEFVRRMHLVAIALAAAGSLVLLIAVDWLVRAWFIETPDLMLIWPACLGLWLVALLGTKRYYERSR